MVWITYMWKLTLITISPNNIILIILANSKFILVKDTNIFSQSFFRLGNYKWDVKNFTPNEWEIVVSSSVPGVYCFFQNFYPNWKLYVDGKEKQIFHCNLSFMGFTLNEGVHNITFRYHSNSIKYAYFISLLVFLIVFILALKAFGNLIHFKSDGDTTPWNILFSFISLNTFFHILYWSICLYRQFPF